MENWGPLSSIRFVEFESNIIAKTVHETQLNLIEGFTRNLILIVSNQNCIWNAYALSKSKAGIKAYNEPLQSTQKDLTIANILSSLVAAAKTNATKTITFQSTNKFPSVKIQATVL